MGHSFPMSSSVDLEYQEFMARVSRVNKHLPAAGGRGGGGGGRLVLILKPSLINMRESENHVWATLRCAYVNCCPTYGICLNTRFANPTKVQLF